MATTYAGVSSNPWTDPVLPDDGDDEDAASVDVALEVLADRTAYLKALRHPATLESKIQKHPQYDWSRWDQSQATPAGLLEFTAHTTQSHTNRVVYDVVAPSGCTITGAFMKVRGAPGHGAFPGGKPAKMPKIELWKRNGGSGGTLVGSATDGSGSAGAFEANHNVNFACSEVLDNGAPSGVQMQIFVYPEADTNAQNGFVICEVWVTYDQTNLDPGGG